MQIALSDAWRDVCRRPSEMIQVLPDILQRWWNGSVCVAHAGTIVRIQKCRRINKLCEVFLLFLREPVTVSCLSLLTMHRLRRSRVHISQKSGLDRAEILLMLMILSWENCN